VKRTEFARVIGKVPETLQRVREDVTAGMPASASLEFWTERARDISPQVRERRAAVLAAELEVKKVQAEHLPRLDLVGSTGSMANSENTATPLNYSSRSQSSEIMLQLIVPIFSGGGILARTRETQAEVVQAQAQLESVLREVDSLTEQAFLGVASGLAEVQALEAAREAARSALSANQTSFRLGARTLVDVLNAQQQLFTVERDLLKARHGLLVNNVKFTLATQEFDIETMRTVNLWFDPVVRR
jgi:outer membrane protein